MLIQEDGTVISESTDKQINNISTQRYKIYSCDKFIKQYKQYDIALCITTKKYYAFIDDLATVSTPQDLIESLIQDLNGL